MAYEQGRIKSEPLILRQESSNLILTKEVASRIENFVQTEEGTLRSVHGPAPFVPKNEQGDWPSAYSTMYGIYHATLGEKDITLLHSGTSIYMFQGWDTATPWKKIVSASGTPLLKLPLEAPTTPQFPTQFEATPKGIVIAPQNGQRSVIFNGTVVLELGYNTLPPAPVGYGPESSATDAPNDEGYSVGRHSDCKFTLHADMGFGRLGTIEAGTGSSESRLKVGSYQCAYQWINYFGDLSPLSSRSNEVRFSSKKVSGAAKTSEEVRLQVLWGNIATGPDGTLGRVLARSHDLENSGTTELFIVPGNVGYGAISSFATMPDNIAVKWPDNVPDIWCVAPAHDPMPVPTFKLCKLAFGRLWIANTNDDPGILIPSLVGRYGTFQRGTQLFPDPSGGEITGLWSVDNGLLAFTRTSTYLITVNDDGSGFRSSTLSPNIGCVAPSSIANMPDGSTMWLGREGFYKLSEEGFELVSVANNVEMKRINPLRAKQACAAYDPTSKEYRCWVALDASTTNNTCFVYDGMGFRRRTTETVASVCVTKDHRNYMLTAGTVKDSNDDDNTGVWVLDRQVSSFSPKNHLSEVETGWITWVESMGRRTAKTIYLAFRESANASATISVYRDWRKKSTATYSDTSNATLYSPEDIPPFWGTASWSTDREWIKKRPYWKRVDISIPSCEVYKIVISTSNSTEFIALVLDEEPKLGGMTARIP